MKHLISLLLSLSLFFPVLAQNLTPTKDFLKGPSQGKYGYKNELDKLVIDYRFDEVAKEFSEGLAWVKYNGKYGFIDKTGRFVIQPQFEKVDKTGAFSDGLACVMQNGKWGFINKWGIFVIPPEFDELYNTMNNSKPFIDGLAPAKKDGAWGYIDKTGKFVIEPKYVFCMPFSEGLGVVDLDGDHGLMDKTGKFVVEPQYDEIHPLSEGLAAVALNRKWGFIDKTGKMVIKPQFDDAGSFKGDRAVVIKNDKKGIIDRTGKIIVKPKYDWIRLRDNGSAFVCLTDKKTYTDEWGFVNKKGDLLLKPKFKSIDSSEDVIICMYSDGLYIYADEQGKGIGYSYYGAKPFSEGLASVRKSKTNGHYSFIDKTGWTVIKPTFDSAESFSRGLAVVSIGRNHGYIDKKGNFYKSREEAYSKMGLPYEEYMSYAVQPFQEILDEKGVLSTDEAVKLTIESMVRDWQKKGEFEKLDDYKRRVNEQTRKAKAEEVARTVLTENDARLSSAKVAYRTEVEARAKDFCAAKSSEFAAQDLALKPYDPENQTYLISTSQYGDILLPVPIEKAPAFKSDWERIKKSVKAKFVPVGDDVALQSVAFGPYVYDSSTKATYAQVDVADNFRPIDISSLDLSFGAIDDVAAAPAVSTTPVLSKREVTPERTKIEVGSSDVDVNIPASGRKAANTFAVIIANKDYQHASKVNNAANDGRVMEQYLNLTLGLPKENITTCIDATYGQINSALRHLQDIGRAYRDEDFNVIFYYVGHGLPDDENRESYILPVDVDPRDTRVCYPLKEVYSLLGGLGAKNVTVMIDACFSGANHGDGMLMADAMAVAIKPKETNPMGNTVVLAAAQGDETAYPYAEKSHGLFTYWLLKKLQETKGDVTLGELSDYVKDKVFKTSTVINHKPQTPSVSTSPSLATTWRTLPFSR